MSEKNKNELAEQKAKAKLDKLKQKEEAKRIKKEQKSAQKEQMQELYKQLDGDKNLTKEEKIKKAKDVKIKKHKEKINYKLALKEAPIKMLKEINKIKWSDRKNLGQKFSWVIVFLIVFGIFFYAVDTALQYLFTLAKII
ncbi:preprotein translocase subunit SecE [Spiroplasma chinense]|uniref:Preprotein translocase subunit SecE n=1 Tax=Spiroplasma chinense TaxID=216932 RepID=A0A5B9Y3A7_9MOLU|nr:preprotein translocase subunit SecE [Spiroplasma chinense]QEH61233.1 preprotein translocase subunit SecE [Spiroplasma chinense]